MGVVVMLPKLSGVGTNGYGSGVMLAELPPLYQV